MKVFNSGFCNCVQVDREKKRAAAAAAREKREQAAKSWFGWMRGASKQTVCYIRLQLLHKIAICLQHFQRSLLDSTRSLPGRTLPKLVLRAQTRYICLARAKGGAAFSRQSAWMLECS